jgi:triacylglycerol esterase/lipase EstA (alpha/beta hydrolase family)
MRTAFRSWLTRVIGVVAPVGVALACVLAVVAPATPASASTWLPGEGSTFLSSTLVWNWYASPSGANTGCMPSAQHPYPVVLSEGTFANMYNSFGAISPYLADQGYCVYAFNYGQTIAPSMFDAMGNIANSAAQLRSFVDQVLAVTGASKVDIVGWSQGGMMPRYYINDLGGASYVHELVALAPSNYGTTLDGIQQLVDSLGADGVVTSLLSPFCEACVQQLQGSSFLDALNAGGGTRLGVHYVVIETRYDEVVTPYTNAFLSGPNVQDILLQNQCSQDHSDHLSIPYDSNALQDVANALGADNPSFQPSCASVGPLLGNV